MPIGVVKIRRSERESKRKRVNLSRAKQINRGGQGEDRDGNLIDTNTIVHTQVPIQNGTK